MSIPPLVCSTPPPPDQCEDDKDPEDFELSYSLSQEDDDDDDDHNGYNYGNFSSYNNFQPTPDNKPLEMEKEEITKTLENAVQKEIYLKYESKKEVERNIASHNNVFQTNDINENKLKCDEDLNIEDLNLKVDEEIESVVESNTEQLEISEPSIGSVKDFDIPSNSNNDNPSCDNSNVSSFDETTVDVSDALKEFNTPFVEQTEVQSIDEVIAKNEAYVNSTETISIKPVIDINTAGFSNDLDNPVVFEDTLTDTEHDTQVIEQSTNLFEMKSEQNVNHDDFGDFDDFQSVNIAFVETSNNPWDNVEPNEAEFKSFTANFEEDKFQNMAVLTPLESVSITNNLDLHETIGKETDDNLEDDDFGDFDDFQSSSVKSEQNEFASDDLGHCQDLPVLNLQTAESDHQIMESITKVLSSVFLEEISEPDNPFESKLESLLSETWGHLMETDERQPYIVNWNNSLGQKTLLRALCIDSRNILFGPKWSSNMPKYAANLSNAPLQPQKQVSVPSSIVPQNEVVTEKSTSKPTTWTDPFTSDGQESCNTENESATITPAPTDVAVFEAAIPTKSDKIYSNTIGVQPIRQINLPDTHIFTPTDSEIPRSKTIHYDRAPTVLLPPQPAMVENKNQTDTINTPNTNNSVENNEDDNEYWEFQNFKSTSDTSSLPGNLRNSQQQVTSQEKKFETASTVNALPKASVAYQAELLQPIKVEPAMPTLNWPDPGEVKGVFDDFSDFVSISSQLTDKQDTSSIQPVETRLKTVNTKILDNVNVLGDSTEATTEVNKPDNDDFDDDFDTFQSALPSKIPSDNFKSSLETTSNQTLSSQITEYDNGSPKSDSIKSDTISFASILRPNEALTHNVNYFPNIIELTNKSSLPSGTQIPTNLLQPTPASCSTVNTQNQQKSAQILQPLSLESYSQINWPSPGIDLQDLSRFNPVETLQSLKSDLSVSGINKVASPAHVAKNTVNQVPDDDVWGEFVSSKPKQQQQQSQPKKPSAFVDDDEWTDFISSTSVKPQNGLNTISLNVHTNSNIHKSVQNKFAKKSNQPPLDIPTLNYITPKTNPHKSYNDKHFQNL